MVNGQIVVASGGIAAKGNESIAILVFGPIRRVDDNGPSVTETAVAHIRLGDEFLQKGLKSILWYDWVGKSVEIGRQNVLKK